MDPTIRELAKKLEAGRIEGLAGDRVILASKPYSDVSGEQNRVVLCYWNTGGEDVGGQFVVWTYNPSADGYFNGSYFNHDQILQAAQQYSKRGIKSS